jgi:hypothetical protein
VTFVAGHRIGLNLIGHFPHLCPGEGCAVGHWLAHWAGVERLSVRELTLDGPSQPPRGPQRGERGPGGR